MKKYLFISLISFILSSVANASFLSEHILVANANTLSDPVVVNTGTTEVTTIIPTATPMPTATPLPSPPAVPPSTFGLLSELLENNTTINGESIPLKGEIKAKETDELDIKVTMKIETQDIGKPIDLYLVVIVTTLVEGEDDIITTFMKTAETWATWDLELASLLPLSSVVANASHTISVYQGVLPKSFGSQYQIYVGYKNAEGQLNYNNTPISINIE